MHDHDESGAGFFGQRSEQMLQSMHAAGRSADADHNGFGARLRFSVPFLVAYFSHRSIYSLIDRLPAADRIWPIYQKFRQENIGFADFGTNRPGLGFPLEHPEIWMANRDVLAIGTSAGGFDALRFLAGEFPRDFPASVAVAIHLSSQFRSALGAILTQAGPLLASFAIDGEKLERSHIYIAPAERHLLVESGHLRLGSGPRENNARPSLDPLFRPKTSRSSGARGSSMKLRSRIVF